MGNRDGSRGGARLEYPGPLAEGGGESMSVEDNLKVIETATKALNDRDFDRYESLHLNSVLQRGPQNPEGLKVIKAIRASLDPLFDAFPHILSMAATLFRPRA